MRLTLLWAGTLLIALGTAACGNDEDGGTANGPCGSNGACPTGFTCEPRTNICLPTTTPDARRPADGGPDSPATDGGTTSHPDTGTGTDGGSTGNPDGGSTGSAPVTTITPEFTSPVNSRTVSFALTVSIAGSTLECSIDGGAFEACSSPFSATLPTDGPHALTARATGPGGAAELNPPRSPFVIDTVAPVIAIDSPPPGATIGASTLAYSSSEPLKSFLCSFDGAAAVACGSGTAGSTPISLPNGMHMATVTGSDLAGNPGNVASVSFTVDSTVLSVSIDAHQTPCVNDPISFAASQAGATFSCDLDGTVTDGCTSPFPLPGNITGGSHGFTVTATLGAATATNSLTFKIDRLSPNVDIISILPDNSNDPLKSYDPSGNVFFTTNKPGSAAACAVDDLPVDCNTTSGEGSFPYGPLDDAGNTHSATITITDACGATAMSVFPFNVDSTPPAPCLTDVHTTGGPDLNNKGACLVAAPKSGRSGTLTFGSEKGSYDCTLHTTVPPSKLPGTPPVTTIGPFSCAPGTPIAFSNLTDFGGNGRTWTLSVAGIDVHGNHSVVALDWTVDATAPTVVLGAGTANPGAGTLRVAYTVTPALDVTEGVTFPTCTLDGNACTCDNTGMTCTDVAAGDHVAAVTPRDHWTNTGFSATNANPLVMAYGPNSGRLILIGHDFDADNVNSTALLTQALEDVPGVESGVFLRKPRVLWLAPATGNAAAFANVSAVWANIIDVAGSDALDDATKIDAELPGHDILFVFDQNSAATSTTIGTAWNAATSGGETHLTHFLNNGGTVIVLDGIVGTNPQQHSDTWHVVSDGAIPAMGVDSTLVVATGDTVTYEPALNETLHPTDVSDLHVADEYDAPVNTVGFLITDTELDAGQPRFVYGASGSCEGCESTVVFEKVFPVYTMAVAPPPDQGFYQPGQAVPLTVTPATQGAIDCTLRCGSGFCPCVSQTGICACPSTGPNAFSFPAGTADFEMEFVQKDPAGRPGRVLDIFAETALNIETLDINPGENSQILCLRVNPAAPSPDVAFAVGPNSIDVTELDPQTNAACTGYAASLTLTRCGGGAAAFTATDQAGNTGFKEVVFNFGSCQ